MEPIPEEEEKKASNMKIGHQPEFKMLIDSIQEEMSCSEIVEDDTKSRLLEQAVSVEPIAEMADVPQLLLIDINEIGIDIEQEIEESVEEEAA